MKVPRKQAAFIHDAINQWTHDGLLPTAQAALLAATIEVQGFDWRRLAKYLFWVALFSIVTSVSAALSGKADSIWNIGRRDTTEQIYPE